MLEPVVFRETHCFNKKVFKITRDDPPQKSFPTIKANWLYKAWAGNGLGSKHLAVASAAMVAAAWDLELDIWGEKGGAKKGQGD